MDWFCALCSLETFPVVEQSVEIDLVLQSPIWLIRMSWNPVDASKSEVMDPELVVFFRFPCKSHCSGDAGSRLLGSSGSFRLKETGKDKFRSAAVILGEGGLREK